MRFLRAATALAACLASVAGAQAVDQRTLPPEVADEVMQAFSAPATRRVDGALTVAAGEEVRGDLAVLGGPLVVAGHVAGRIVVVNGDLEFRSGATVDGDVLVVGGRVSGRDDATVRGTVRTYAARAHWTREGDRLVRDDEDDDRGRWWQRRERWRERGWGDIKFVSARTYNRVEGLPVQAGPAIGREFSWGRASFEALGILRSANSFEWSPENVGHSARFDLRIGNGSGVRLGARAYDVVDAVEPWHLSDSEVGLSSFFLHRDFRDYYNRHGGSVSASLFARRGVEVGTSYAHERWATRDASNPWTLFRSNEAWRENPQMDEGVFHLLGASATYDTRNDERNPWSGWYLSTQYELGTGTTSRYAPTSVGVRTPTVGGKTTYDRAFVDLRRYNRVAPNAQVNLRLAFGGWLSGDELPLQRRYSLGGPGTLPGYDFRQVQSPLVPGAVDYLTCASYAGASVAPVGTPAECERFALGQVEFRGDLDLDPFGILGEDRDWRRRGWGRGTQWVVFADAGRGWLVGPEDGGRSYGKSALPPLRTFRTDVGIGLVLDDLGLYVAKSLSRSDAPVNFILRLRPRF